MNNVQIVYDPEESIVKTKAIEALNTSFEQHKQHAILFLSSGGSAFDLLDGIHSDLLGSHVTISVLDERYSEDPTVNNFAQLMNTDFYKRAYEQDCHFIDTKIKTHPPKPDMNWRHETQAELTQRMEEALHFWRNNNPEGFILATQGIGPDGHTSGIMPFPENPELFNKLFEQDNWVAGYDASGKNPYPLRVTTTIPFLKNIIDESILYITGSKKEALHKILQSGSISEIPGRIILQMKSVLLFTNIQYNG